MDPETYRYYSWVIFALPCRIGVSDQAGTVRSRKFYFLLDSLSRLSLVRSTFSVGPCSSFESVEGLYNVAGG